MVPELGGRTGAVPLAAHDLASAGPRWSRGRAPAPAFPACAAGSFCLYVGGFFSCRGDLSVLV